eukprot:515722_1
MQRIVIGRARRLSLSIRNSLWTRSYVLRTICWRSIAPMHRRHRRHLLLPMRLHLTPLIHPDHQPIIHPHRQAIIHPHHQAIIHHHQAIIQPHHQAIIQPSDNPSSPSDNPTASPSDNPSSLTIAPTTYPTVSPTSDTTSPSQAPTAKLEWCVDPSIIDGWYDGDSIDIANNVWTDKSVNNNDGNIGVSTGIGVSDGTTETHELFTYFNKTAVYGETTTQITFNVDLHPINHTVFNYCKYREVGQKYRIIQTGPENGCFGFWRGSGQAFENNWITDGNTDWFGNEWVISAQQHDLYRGNRIDKTDNPTATFAQTNQLMIGLGSHPVETSAWACTEIIIINQKIPLDDIICIENYLLEKYS